MVLLIGVALFAWLASTCRGAEPTNACPQPNAGSPEEAQLLLARAQAGFPVLYPCQLPAGQRFSSASVIGTPGRRQAELVFAGPYDLTIRQAQFAPPVTPDPTGASRIEVDLFPNVRATLIETNDGTRHAAYHLYWDRDGVYYELQAVGPPLQRRQILQIATSLE